MKVLLSIAIIILFIGDKLSAQSLSNLRVNNFHYTDSIKLDSLSIVPGSLILYDNKEQIIPLENYQVLHDQSILVIKETSNSKQPFKAIYRVFPISFHRSFGSSFWINEQIIAKNSAQPSILSNSNYKETNSGQSIQVNGNISRGLSAGNGQNMVLNSNLNLQLTGEVDDGLFIEAVLSDENVPVQPNGYTQQVNAFDQIFIRIYDSLRYLQMGDVDIKNTPGYFLKFQRQLQGADFAGAFSKNNRIKIHTQSSAAIAKGNFNRSEFLGIEGVQGPYPLFGANQERYIIILAGSERVFIDGKRLTRGENADYIMNYNTAEISFTSNKLITKDSRIIVEYEYSDRNYNRFLVYGSSAAENDKSKVSFQFFSEGDAKNQSLNQTLNDEQKHILSQAGDDPYKAITPDYDSVPFDKNRVLYAMVDTLVQGVLYDSIFTVSFNPDSAYFQVGFALVGSNKGNYKQVPSAANGKVYQWIAPENGRLQGNYEPIQLLIAPKTQQMMIIGLEQQISENTKTGVEVALSNQNQNTFSAIDNENNKGLAIKSDILQKFQLNRLELQTIGNYEFTNRNFKEIERFRTAEFDRDWNIDLPQTTDHHLATAGFALKKRQTTLLDLKIQYLNRPKTIEGARFSLSSNLSNNKNEIKTKQSLLINEDLTKHTQFYIHDIFYQHKLKIANLGVRHEMESNLQKDLVSDSLLIGIQQFSRAEVFLQMHDTLKRNIGIAYKNRLDYLPYQNTIIHSSTAHDIEVKSKLAQLKNNNLKLSAIYRNLQIANNKILQNIKNEESFLARIDHQLQLAKNTFNFSTFYELGSGLEAKQNFVYVEVAMGQGIYIWEDYNGNDIPELDEFEISKFVEEANYIRIYTPSNEYTKAYTLKMNHTFKVNPYRLWRRELGLKKVLSRFSNVSSLRINKKQTDSDIISRINPFDQNIKDTALLNNRTNIKNTFSFNRSNPKFSADWIFTYGTSRNLLVNGFDQSNQKSNQIQLRWNITPSISLRNNINKLVKLYASEFFTHKNYKINGIINDANIQWHPNPKFRTTIQYKYSDKANSIGFENSIIHEIGPGVKFSKPGKGTLSAKFLAIFTQYNGNETSSVSYEMLNGYAPGENYKWNLSIAYNLNKYLRLSCAYNGRKALDSPTIHTGQASLSAFF